MLVPGEHVDFHFSPDDDDDKSVPLEVEVVFIEKHFASGVNYKYAV